jgi:catechol 2,3-dioxygenase-like lactoylglutathione lyase family enzyme
MFKINSLDHVAIRVRDIEKSAEWYKETLGLKKYQLDEWGDYPIFMLAGKSGIALFPAGNNQPATDHSINTVKIDHFAFNVSTTAFEEAKQWFEESGVQYKFQDHHYFHSIYINDPDGHTVELTTLVVPEDKFY